MNRRKLVPVLGVVAALMSVSGPAATASESVDDSVPSFRNHVQPVLARFGCSSGACHGAAAGQNGFRLSLRGYDDEGDYLALTRNALGRRIVPADPGRSLLLLKPTGALPHKGGKKFEVDSPEYRLLARWIAEGAPGPAADDPRIERVEILPDRATAAPGDKLPFTVRAHFSNGRVEEVTRWAKYTSANESVGAIDENGTLTVAGHGEGAVTAWYLSRIATATVSAPFTNRVEDAVFAAEPARNFIDQRVVEKLRSLNLPPSGRCGDAEFIRRAFLDTIGTLPTAAETRAFMAECAQSSSAARDRLIESLLNRPEFVDYWTYRWSDLLLVSSRKLPTPAMWSYYRFIRNHVAANTPWDEFVRRLLTARGSTLENGAGYFYILHEDPRLMAETSTQAFLGMSINCARCHNHPMEKWTNEQYFKFANLFARVRSKTGMGEGDHVIFAAAEGDVIQPLTGKAPPPAPLDGAALDPDDPADRRQALANWLAAPENPYFTRSIVNRVWANFFGVGLVEPVDDLRVTNPASNELLLSEAARFLASNRYDLKALMRAILQSTTYQRSSVPLPENQADSRFYSRYYPRRLMAEVLLDACSQVTGVPTEFQVDLRNENRGLGEKYPLGLRAIQLPDTKIASYFLKTFGRPDREKTCECERTAEPNVAQVLHIANGESLNQKLRAADNVLTRQLAGGSTPGEWIEESYLAALSRLPTPAEKERLLREFNPVKEEDRREILEDLYWALMSSREFLFNH